MGYLTNIEWTEATWNPWHGCHKISPGCKHCYMFRDKARYGQDPNVVVRSKTTFQEPLKWKEPKVVFTCSWSDWFIEEADAWRDEAYEVIRRTPHTYQILTKRIDRAAGRIPNPPLLNVWLGVSIEGRKYKDRIDILRELPAAIRFLSFEPLLGDLGTLDLRGIHWVIAGGESGPDARPSHPDWFRSVRDQCLNAGVPYFHKQNGEWAPGELVPDERRYPTQHWFDERWTPCSDDWATERDYGTIMYRVGKKAAGRLLDGQEWSQFPEVLND